MDDRELDELIKNDPLLSEAAAILKGKKAAPGKKGPHGIATPTEAPPPARKRGRRKAAKKSKGKATVTTRATAPKDPAEAYPEILTVGTAADYLQVSRRQVYKLLDLGAIPAKRVGQRWRFSKEQLRRLVEGKKT